MNLGDELKNAYKIVFCGAMGAGKTTAIHTISDVKPVKTEVKNNDPSNDKPNTTVAMDFGKVNLGKEQFLHLYGTPGQARFRFMWPIISRNALGIIILIRNSDPDVEEQLALYLESFADAIRNSAAVIGVTFNDQCDDDKKDACQAVLDNFDMSDIPIFSIDAREYNHVLLLINTITSLNEAKAFLKSNTQ